MRRCADWLQAKKLLKASLLKVEQRDVELDDALPLPDMRYVAQAADPAWLGACTRMPLRASGSGHPLLLIFKGEHTSRCLPT